MRYVLLIYGQGQALSDEVEQQVLERHRALQREAADDLVAVAKLDVDQTSYPAVTGRQARHELMDGPHAETKEWLVGFYMVDCATQEQALARARQICCIDNHRIEVRRVSWSGP
jgi:hypothetical protein